MAAAQRQVPVEGPGSARSRRRDGARQPRAAAAPSGAPGINRAGLLSGPRRSSQSSTCCPPPRLSSGRCLPRAGGTGPTRAGSPRPDSPGDGESSGISLAFTENAAKPRRTSTRERRVGADVPFPAAVSLGVPRGRGVLRPSQNGPGSPTSVALCALSSDGHGRSVPAAPQRGADTFRCSLGQRQLPLPASL